MRTAKARRAIARATTWWFRLFVVSVILLRFADLPLWIEWGLILGFLALAMVRPRWNRDQRPVVVQPPVRGRWAALNSPASKVPSHGIRAYGQTYALDILHPAPAGTRGRIGWGLGTHRPETFSTFGEPVRAMADGVVVGVSRRQRDHRSRGSWLSLLYLLVVEGFVRELSGARFVVGNHVTIDHGDGVYSVVAHLKRGSVTASVGDRVFAGEQLGEVGNSGNSSEPHLHVQLMDRPAFTAAAGVPLRWSDIDIVVGDVDQSRSTTPVSTDIEPGLPANGQVFSACGPVLAVSR